MLSVFFNQKVFLVEEEKESTVAPLVASHTERNTHRNTHKKRSAEEEGKTRPCGSATGAALNRPFSLCLSVKASALVVASGEEKRKSKVEF